MEIEQISEILLSKHWTIGSLEKWILEKDELGYDLKVECASLVYPNLTHFPSGEKMYPSYKELIDFKINGK